jgi:hypothetical protein
VKSETSHGEESLTSLVHSKVGAGNSGGKRALSNGYLIENPELFSFFFRKTKSIITLSTVNTKTDIIIFNLLIKAFLTKFSEIRF